MTLSDKVSMRQVIGSLMHNPLLFLQYPDINPNDFDDQALRVCFVIIKNFYEEGSQSISPMEVDLEIQRRGGASVKYYEQGCGLDNLNAAYEFSDENNFKVYYTRLKKYSLLRRLKKEKYDISSFFLEDKDIDNPLIEAETIARFDAASIEDILNEVEGKYSIIRNDYLNGGHSQGNPAEGINELIEELKRAPNVGPSLEGKIFSTVCRGARPGCFYLRSAPTSVGKSRTAIFDACHLAYPIRWSEEKEDFIREIAADGMIREPRKVLFIVTEMDKQEVQTIMLAYLSGVNEEHILTGHYEEFGEEQRVKYAARIIKEYEEYFFIEEISEPNLVNVEATIKKYVLINDVRYVFYDYIHETPSMLTSFGDNVRSDQILMMMSNQLKQVAKDYGIFIFSSTQVNASGMDDDGSFKNEMCLRSAKSIADKIDGGFIMSKISEKFWNSLIPTLRQAAAKGLISNDILLYPPTHIVDIYKMRRGRYKNVRIWIRLDLGTGYRKDLFMTTADNQPLQGSFDLFSSAREEVINWKD